MVDDSKKFFSFCKRIDTRIQAKVDEQARYRELAMKTSASISGSPGGGSGENKIEYCVARISELEDEINQEIDLLIGCRRIAKMILNRIDDGRYCDVIALRYFSGYTWDQVKMKMHYENTHLWRIHGYALVAAQKVIDDICSKDCEERRMIFNIVGKME